MAGMKGFYVGLGAIAVFGAGALATAMVRGGASLPSGPIDISAIEEARGFGGYSVGDPGAPVEIVEFADFECPACRMDWVLVIHDVKQRLVNTGRVRLVFRDFPLNMHINARAAHHSAACVAEQGKFWEMHDRLFETQSEWTGRSGAERMFRGYARDLGVDLDEYDACTREGRFRARIQASVEGAVSLGVGSTPSYLVGDRLYTFQSYDQVKAVVDSLAGAATQ